MGGGSSSQIEPPHDLKRINLTTLNEKLRNICQIDDDDTSCQVVKIVVVSDTHNQLGKMTIPNGDILIHCGDFSNYKTSLKDIVEFNNILGTLPHKHKIVVGGNHDNSLSAIATEKDLQAALPNCIYLCDSGVTVNNIKIWGAPWTPTRNIFKRANAFSVSESVIKDHWECIPKGVDILITHCPPQTVHDIDHKGYNLGCPHLLVAVQKVAPKVHVFGHNHDDPGASILHSTVFINAASLLRDTTTRPPIAFDFCIKASDENEILV